MLATTNDDMNVAKQSRTRGALFLHVGFFLPTAVAAAAAAAANATTHMGATIY